MTTPEGLGAQTELLDNVVATAQRLVKAEKDTARITPAFIAEKVDLAAKIFAGETLHLMDQERAVAILIQRYLKE